MKIRRIESKQEWNDNFNPFLCLLDAKNIEYNCYSLLIHSCGIGTYDTRMKCNKLYTHTKHTDIHNTHTVRTRYMYTCCIYTLHTCVAQMHIKYTLHNARSHTQTHNVHPTHNTNTTHTTDTLHTTHIIRSIHTNNPHTTHNVDNFVCVSICIAMSI